MHILLELFSIHFPYSTDKENLFNNQEIFEWVVISFILIALMFESVLIMYREIRCSSFIGLIDWKIEECSLSEIIGSKFKVEGSTRVTLYLSTFYSFKIFWVKFLSFCFDLQEANFFFGDKSFIGKNTASFSNCTLCIIKPHAIIQGIINRC